ncbi:uncharacterized protein LOC121421791 [Lytechinus variegatus]|uniref:uncharacterized protein LOC121421791 n=1 Tax=Lytechinus variegatus TaxID=7654 RepID=UPI001BB1B671|nr:uncharacterized protein LOC121421791 [Lytechinus variegatus]
MLETQENLTKIAFVLFHTIFALLFIRCGGTIISSIEGERIEMDFPYPCNISSRVTFQYGNRAPYYNSANPGSMSLPSNQNLTFDTESDNNECSLHLIINPVSRDDAGTYILTAYNANNQYIYDERVGLRVSYPPGKAKCDSSEMYIDGEWITIQCSAPVGNVPGHILCYQTGMRLPPLTSPEVISGRLRQVMLARLPELVYCCSSTTQEVKGRCDCKDTSWNPIRSDESNVTDPCPIITSTATTPLSHTATFPTTEGDNTVRPTTTARANDFKSDKHFDYFITLLVLIVILLVLTCCMFAYILYSRYKGMDHRYIDNAERMSHLTDIEQHEQDTPLQGSPTDED